MTRTKPTGLSVANPALLLFGRYHRDLLGLLLLHPDQTFHIREIVRLTGVSAGSAHRELKRLAEAGLLKRTRIGNQVHYQADRGSAIFEELASIFRKTVGIADVLRELLAPLRKQIAAAFIFGSVAQGKEGPHSDVDLMVIGSPSFESVIAAVNPAHERLRREVNAVVVPEKSFRSKLGSGDRFVTRVLSEPRIMLMGDLSELG
jgi:predicted nucleotidyltransferase